MLSGFFWLFRSSRRAGTLASRPHNSRHRSKSLAGKTQESVTNIERHAPQSSRGRERRARILKAATDLFLKTGYGDTSIDAIVEKSGGSKATLYTYFPTKDDLFRAVIEGVVSNRKEPELDSSADIRTALVTFGVQRMQVVFSRQHRALLRLIIAERERFPDIARLYYDIGPMRSHDLLVDYFSELKDRGLLDVESPAESADFFIGMLLHQWYINQLYTRVTPPSLEEMQYRAERVVDTFLGRTNPLD